MFLLVSFIIFDVFHHILANNYAFVNALKEISPNPQKNVTWSNIKISTGRTKFPYMVKISSQVVCFCCLAAFIFNLNGIKWLKSVWKCYSWHLRPNSHYFESIGIPNTVTQSLWRHKVVMVYKSWYVPENALQENF